MDAVVSYLLRETTSFEQTCAGCWHLNLKCNDGSKLKYLQEYKPPSSVMSDRVTLPLIHKYSSYNLNPNYFCNKGNTIFSDSLKSRRGLL